MKKSSEDGNGVNEIINERMKLRDRLRSEFPEAESVIIRSSSVEANREVELATVDLSADGYAKSSEKINKLKEKLLHEPLVHINYNNDNSGFCLKGPSPSHLLAIFQE